MHAHKSRHIHASHAHTHDTMYAPVYICAHCGRKGHLAKFCYDKLNDSNFANRYVWVRKGVNPHGPKSMDTKSHSYFIWCRCGLSHDMRGVGAIRWMRFELNGDIFGCITFKESLVGGPPLFGDIEMSPIDFGNYLLLPFSLHDFIIDFSMF